MPTLDRVTPDRGRADGGDIVRLLGAGFAERVRVSFGGSDGEVVASRAEGALWVIDVRTPAHPEGVVDVEARSLATDGAEIAGERAVLASAFRFLRPRLADETDLTRLVRALLRALKRSLAANTSMRVHVDYGDERHVDGARVVPLAELPALVLTGPDLRENRVYASNEGREEVVAGPSGPEVVRHGPRLTVDLELRLTGSSDHTVELLNLMAATGAFLARTKWIEMPRDPARPELGVARWELRAGDRFARSDGAGGVSAFTVDLTVRGFDLGEGGVLDVTRPVDSAELTPRGGPT